MTGVSERIVAYGAKALTDEELLVAVTGRGVWTRSEKFTMDRLPFATVGELVADGLTASMAERLVAAFELGRRAAWEPPKRGERCLDPSTVANLMRRVALEPIEEFHVVLLDVRGRLLRTALVSRGGLTQCPVSPRDALRPAVREGAHGVVFVHNHPSGDPAPSVEDADLTDRLRAASELVGLVARDHVIVASGGYYSFVEAGRWGRRLYPQVSP